MQPREANERERRRAEHDLHAQEHADEVRAALEGSRWPVVWGDAATVSNWLEEFTIQPAGQFSTFEPVIASEEAATDGGGDCDGDEER